MRRNCAASIDDLRRLAKPRIPCFALDLVNGSAESERNRSRKGEVFEEVELTPRCMVDVSEINMQATIFGQTFDLPFGMAPIGMLNAFWQDADLTRRIWQSFAVLLPDDLILGQSSLVQFF